MRYIIVISLLLMFGCRSKQKATERTNESTDRKEVIDESQRTRETVTANLTEKGYNYSDYFKTLRTGSFKQADPTKVIVIKDETGRTYEVRGADFDLSEQRETLTKIDSYKVELNTVLDRLTDIERDYRLLLEENKKSRTSDVDVKTTSTWIYIVLIVLGIVAILLFGFRRYFPFILLFLFLGCNVYNIDYRERYKKELELRKATEDSLKSCYKCLHKAHSNK